MRKYLMCVWFALMLVFVLTNQSEALIFAGYQADFQEFTFPSHWQYQWNAPGDWDPIQGQSAGNATDGAIGNSAYYRDLIWVSGSPGDFWGPDGDNSGQNGAPGSFVRLYATGGHTGLGSSQTGGVNNRVDRYAIAAYTITSYTVGPVSIVDSFINRPAGPGLLDLRIYVNDVLKFSADNVGAYFQFDQFLGNLVVGDTIYVAAGPHGADTSDSFCWDFSFDNPTITPIPEPGTLYLLGLGLIGVLWKFKISKHKHNRR